MTDRRWCENLSTQDNSLPAPQPKCRCRTCCLARENTLPPDLLRWLHQPNDPTKYSIGPSRYIVQHYLSIFCAGQTNEPWVDLIIALCEYSDKIVERACQTAMLKPLTMEAKEK